MAIFIINISKKEREVINMAHGGHCGRSHVHHHYRGRSSINIPTPILILIILGVLAISIWEASVKSDIGGKKPLEGTYATYPLYLIDETNYLSDHELIINGLQYLHDKTNVQVVVVVSSGSWSDQKAVDEYYKMFDDEAHMLIIITTSWYEKYDYYAIGDLTNSVIDDRAADYLINTLINNSRNGEKWERVLKEFTDKLLSAS